jgi:hypothetical protein
VLKLLDIADLYNLGLTCCYFWSTVKPEIGKWFTGWLGVWAGTPVICISDESSTDEDAYRQGLLDEDDKDELNKGLTAAEWEDREDKEEEVHVFSVPATLHRLADHRYRVPRWDTPCLDSNENPCPSDMWDV